MKKIFITGGGGYVGTRLIPYLLKKNYTITVYDTFYFGNTLFELTLARAVIGLGVAGCLMATFKIISIWYDKNYWPILYGVCLSSGGLGAIVATKPLYFVVDNIGWRSAFNEVINLGPLLTDVKALVLEKAVAMRAIESFMVRVFKIY